MPSHTVSGNTITFASPLPANEAVFVSYIYGTHYAQTGANDGGLNSIMIDGPGYSARFIGTNLAYGIDWLYDYAGFTDQEKSDAMTMLVRWCDWYKVNGYKYAYPESNYAEGAYAMRSLAAVAISGRNSNDTRLMSEVVSYRQTKVLPLLQNTLSEGNNSDGNKFGSYYGGFWGEGWNYGPLAASNMIISALALKTAGAIPDMSAESTWASQAVQALVSGQSTQANIYDGGDGYNYPETFPGSDLLAVLAYNASDPSMQSYAQYILQHYYTSSQYSVDITDLLFRDPIATGSFWSSLPLQYLASGMGLFTARSDWGTNPTWVSLQLGNRVSADHELASPGHMEIQRGPDNLLVNFAGVTGYQGDQYNSTYANLVVIDDNGDHMQTYRYSMGDWYGPQGVGITHNDSTTAYSYVSGDYHNAYNLNYAGLTGPASELTRQILYVRPNYIIVHDRVTTVKPEYLKRLQWHFLNTPTLSGNSFVATQGSSKLFGETFPIANGVIDTNVTTSEQTVSAEGINVQEITTYTSTTTNPHASERYLTAFQVAPSTTGSMDTTSYLATSDQSMHGVQIGSTLALFSDASTTQAASETYTIPNPGSAVRHYIVDLPASQAYDVSVDSTNIGTAQADLQGVMSFQTSSGAHTVTITQSNNTPTLSVNTLNTSSVNSHSAFEFGMANVFEAFIRLFSSVKMHVQSIINAIESR